MMAASRHSDFGFLDLCKHKGVATSMKGEWLGIVSYLRKQNVEVRGFTSYIYMYRCLIEYCAAYYQVPFDLLSSSSSTQTCG